MNALDRAFALLPARGAAPMVVGHVLDFPAGAFTLDELRGRVAERAPGLEPLGVVADAGARRWTRTPPPEPRVHVREERADGRLAEATDACLRAPLPARPAPGWDLRLLTCLTERVSRVCFRIEHAVTDGVGAAHVVAALLADDPVAGPYPYRPPGPGRASLRWLGASPFERFPEHETVPPGCASVPSGRASLVYADVPDGELRAVASRWGAGVNDVYLTAVAGAFAAFQRREAGRVHDLRVVMPMSVRTEGARLAPGNAALPAVLRLPCTAPGPRERLEAVVAQTRAHKASGLREGGWKALLRMPPRFLLRTTERARFRLAASHIGVHGAYRVLGTPPLAASVFGLNSPGMLGYVSLTRTQATARLAVVHDRSHGAAGDLPALWVKSLAELAERVM
ncbi:wax ester/triacylglycerol synthase domain-containing protein [Streptomyces sp. NPDC085460]|uniref:wax ester/triacylglycerol synthase domain-containing protein n=1 Tax=Streptomyces sp. NPDC085460 TaxID=3365723 RepID=UPI0037D16E88